MGGLNGYASMHPQEEQVEQLTADSIRYLQECYDILKKLDGDLNKATTLENLENHTGVSFGDISRAKRYIGMIIQNTMRNLDESIYANYGGVECFLNTKWRP